ncbi:SIS domain-containing protein [Salibacterium qingdaonense]|nr:SIS domain-containing protein [Salibacterium qingdaonense]
MEEVQKDLELLQENQAESMKKAVEYLAETISNDGIIHVFGAGHSHLLSEEVFYRSGGLVPVNPLLEESLMLHEGAVQASRNERKHHYIRDFLNQHSLEPGDALIVISTSGRNPVPIDAAEYGKEKGLTVIAITSIDYSKSQPSRHESGRRLYESVDMVLDNLCRRGDALLTHPNVPEPYAATSTVIGAVILQTMFAGVIEHLAENGEEPPVFLSGNVDGADEHNQNLVEKYKERIPLLK